MVTTIQISKELLEDLKMRKLYNKESYEEVIRDMLEDTMEVNEETKRDFKLSKEELKKGKTHSLEAVKKELGF